METQQKKFYITTSIAYANSTPHIGYATELLQTDAIARFNRLNNRDVFFLTGTDENGSKIKKTAEEKGMTPKEFVDINSERFRELTKVLNVSNDDFIRTTDRERHHKAAQKLWMKFVESGDIYSKTYQGQYCVGCEAFLTEKDLVDGKCPYHQKAPEAIEENNYFFKMSKYLPEIKEKIKCEEIRIVPEARKNEIINIIENAEKEGMDVSFSRPKKVLDWGVPVPNDEEQTMYVWCDALTNYISALGYGDCNENSPLERGEGCVNFKKFWPANIHLIGKDILRFHAMIWPAMLLSAKLPLPKKICVHGFITSGGQKMSKSLGNVIEPFEIVEKYGTDAVRYYLLKEIPTTGDGDFSYEKFETVYKADLQNGLGNLVARVLAMTEKYFDGKVPECKEEYKQETEFSGIDLIKKTNANLSENFSNFKLDIILEDISAIVRELDGYIQKHEPFKLIKDNPEKTACVIYNCLESIRVIAWMIRPFMPETSDKIFEQLFADKETREKHIAGCPKLVDVKYLEKNTAFGPFLKAGVEIKKGEALFPRLEEENK
jgi:methionyl-tRNA synthetase